MNYGIIVIIIVIILKTNMFLCCNSVIWLSFPC